MRLLFIRHGDPDYEKDSVTEKGAREIGLLADRLVNENIAAAYVSPLGRAQVTAQATLSRIGLAGTTCDWMREFDGTVTMPQTGKKHIFWDFLPSFLEEYPALYSPESWQGVPFVRESDVPQKYAKVCEGLDGVLAAHGYVRQGRHYAVTCANRDTLAFFCHFGVTCVMLSHLFGLSPVPLLHHFAAAPSSVTTVYTEERREGVALFRAAALGDTSHLYAAKEPPSFSARFCEVYDSDERHD